MTVAEGQELSHYRLIEKIGEGGMGRVWRSLDTRLDREVAIKLLPAELEENPERLATLVREAKTVAALNHPNIVTIHAIEEVEGRRFLVMELIRGVTLDKIIPEDGMPLARFFDLAIPLTGAIGAAHELGVIHRDLKPANVMIGHDGRLKVLDFGVARSPSPPLRGDATDAPTTTLPSDTRLRGTVPYMAPEQLKGLPVDPRADLFALGVIFYYMVAGRRPFAGDTPAEVIAAILRDEPPAVTELRPDLPRQLERIIRHAMEKDPRRRFQTSLDLGNELVQLREETERSTRRAGPASRATEAADVRSVAVLPLDNLSGDPDQAYFADGMTDALINTLAHIGALKVISRTSVMQYKDVRKPLPETARELGVDAVIEGSVLRAGERVRITAQLIDAGRDRLLWAESYEHEIGDVLTLQSRVASAIAERIEVELTPGERARLDSAGPVHPGAHEACLKGRHHWYKRTTEAVRKGLRCFEEAVRLDPHYAPAHAGIADSYIVDGGRYLGVSPKVAYAHARAAALKAVELDEGLAEAHTSLAAVMTDYDWDWEGADREYRRAIELNPNYATAHSWYAEQLSRMGRHDEAVAEARRARELDPRSLVSNMIVAWILYFARRYEEAIERGCRTLELDPSYATAHRILGWAYEETGRYDEAIAAHRRAGEAADHQPNFEGQLGRAYALAGRIDEARRVLRDLEQQAARSYVSALDIAIIHTALLEKAEALDWLERAFEERADHLPYLRVNPRLDPLRGEARFQRLLERMNLAG